MPLIRTRSLDDGDGDALQFGIVVPGGLVVAACLTEAMAREFITWLGAEYAARCRFTLHAIDEVRRGAWDQQEQAESRSRALQA